MKEKMPIVRTTYEMPHGPYTHYQNKWVTCLEVEITSENENVDVDVYDGGIGRRWIDFNVTGYNTQILNSKATVYGVRSNRRDFFF